MRTEKDFHHFVYETENFVSEFVIAFSSFAAILITVYSLFGQSAGVGFLTLGRNIYPWMVITGLFIIGRELWIMNHDRHFAARNQAETDQE